MALRNKTLLFFCGLIACCANPGVRASISPQRLTIALLEPQNCILGGDVIDDKDVTIITFLPKSREVCHSRLDLFDGNSRFFYIVGDLSNIKKDKYYMVVVEDNGQWEKRIRVKAELR